MQTMPLDFMKRLECHLDLITSLQWNCCSEIEVVSILLVVQHYLGLTCLQVCFDYLLGCQRYDLNFQLSFVIQMFGLQQQIRFAQHVQMLFVCLV